MRARKAFFPILFSLFFALAFASSISMSGEGFGNSLNDAKANALNDLVSKIAVSLQSDTEVKYYDSSNSTQQSYSRDTVVSSDITLIFVRYDVTESVSKAEKASGKYKCIASISDKDKEQCISRASVIVNEIEKIYDAYKLETDLRARKAYCDALENRFDEYDSCCLTARLLCYIEEIPSYSSLINPEQIAIESKKIQEEMLKAGLDGSMTDTTTEGLINFLLSDLWNGKDTSSYVFSQKTSSEEGFYSKNYKIGDFGPAGGIIFYDKGSFSDGWRYLEVASEDVPGDYVYGKSGKLATSTGLGKGKENTELIIALNGKNGSYAAIACAEYVGGGYDDWYLPSKEELEMIYSKLYGNKNLTMAKTGYWSSSQLNSSYAYGFSFKKKKSFTDSESVSYKVRAVRAF